MAKFKEKMLFNVFRMTITQLLNRKDLSKSQKLDCLTNMFNESLKKHIFDELSSLLVFANQILESNKFDLRLIYDFEKNEVYYENI